MNARHEFDAAITASRRAAKINEDLLARLGFTPCSVSPTYNGGLGPCGKFSIGIASQDPAEDTSRGGPCLTENDEVEP